MQERFFYTPDSGSGGSFAKQEQEETGQINRLSGIFRTRRYGELVFIGWTKEGLPVITLNEDQLSCRARESYESFQHSGLELREIPFRNLTPAEFMAVVEAKDFKDTRIKRAEDVVVLYVKTTEGERVVYVPERTILRSITDTRDNPWQDANIARIGEVESSSKTMYTLFVPTPNKGRDTGLAILFKPVIERDSNEAVFKIFIRETLGKLLAIDESQPKDNRKGYLKPASEIAGLSEKPGVVEQTLRALRKGGFVDFTDQDLEGLRQKGRNCFAKILSLAKEYVQIDEGDIDVIRDPLPYYDLGSLKIEQLFGLAEKILICAENYLR